MMMNICNPCRTQSLLHRGVGGEKKMKKKNILAQVPQYINTPLVVSKKSINLLIFSEGIRAWHMVFVCHQLNISGQHTAGVAHHNSGDLCPFKLDLHSAVSPRWSQLNDLVPLENRSTCL